MDFHPRSGNVEFCSIPLDYRRGARLSSRRMLRLLAVFIVVIASLVPLPCRSTEAFFWDLSGEAARSELNRAADTHTSTVAATYYFHGIDDSKGPLELASFLEPATRVSASIGHQQTTSRATGPGFASVPEVVEKIDEYGLGGRYVLPGRRWYVGGHYRDDDVGPSPLLPSFTADSKDYGLFAGRYFGINTSLELGLDRADVRTEGTFDTCIVLTACIVVPERARRTTDNATLDLLHVRRFRSLTYSLSAGITETSGRAVYRIGEYTLPTLLPLLPGFPGLVVRPVIIPGLPLLPGNPALVVPPFGGSAIVPARTAELSVDRFRVYSVGSELFPTQRLGVRVGYSRWDGSSSIDDAYDVATTWFVTRNIGLRFSLARQHADANSQHRDSTAVHVIGRF